MSKTEYSLMLQQFVNRCSNDVRQAVAETGRKFDRIFFITGSDKSIRYFVSKREVDGWPAGTIFGAKSTLAPNMNWYFGNLSTQEKWDWSGYHGEPTNDDTVEVVKSYGGYKHFRPKVK